LLDLCNEGSLHLVAAREQFTLLRGEDAIATYLFGTATARHLSCRHCGIHSFYVPRQPGTGLCAGTAFSSGVI
jgi:hypothetical protein